MSKGSIGVIEKSGKMAVHARTFGVYSVYPCVCKTPFLSPFFVSVRTGAITLVDTLCDALHCGAEVVVFE